MTAGNKRSDVEWLRIFTGRHKAARREGEIYLKKWKEASPCTVGNWVSSRLEQKKKANKIVQCISKPK